MCIIKDIRHFIRNGALVFSDASRGKYRNHSEEVARLKDEIFSCESNRSDDKRNLVSDRWNIEKDVRKSYEEYVIKHG